MAGVLSWIALSCGSVGLLVVALLPSLTGRMWRTDAVELRRFHLFKEVLTANMSAYLTLDSAADTASGAVRRHVPDDAGHCPCVPAQAPPPASDASVSLSPPAPRSGEAPAGASRT